eukprot:TRINITY_DN26669_c0_g1_i1.p1 TRINITY_DN26669_c0_g1~~TRINITY_DN26669_c0_g1_i1.p1  ORF type:complete len:229 (+),score=34.50 TRINITY_DN26669_c0_g1_i1:237-923(+)
MELQGSHANTLRTMAQVPTVRAVPRPTSASLGSSMKPRRVGRATKETEAARRSAGRAREYCDYETFSRGQEFGVYGSKEKPQPDAEGGHYGKWVGSGTARLRRNEQVSTTRLRTGGCEQLALVGAERANTIKQRVKDTPCRYAILRSQAKRFPDYQATPGAADIVRDCRGNPTVVCTKNPTKKSAGFGSTVARDCNFWIPAEPAHHDPTHRIGPKTNFWAPAYGTRLL